MCDYVSLQTAITLTELSERTLRRRIADGSLHVAKAEDSNKTLVPLATIADYFCLPFDADQLALIHQADQGEVNAQNDLALLFLTHDKYKNALYWLDLAIKQNFEDAMYLMGCCYLSGYGVPKDDNLAIMWLAKAASLGHALALPQVQSIYQNA